MKQVLWDNHNILYLIVNKMIYYQSMAYFISHLMMSNEITSLKIILKKIFCWSKNKNNSQNLVTQSMYHGYS